MIPSEETIITPRCCLRRLATTDLPYIHEAMIYPGFTDYLPETTPLTTKDTEREIERLRSGWEDGTRHVFSAFIGNKFVGLLGLRARGGGLWNVGFWVVPTRWGNGLAGELAAGGLEWAFGTLQASVVQVVHFAAHDRCRRVMEKLRLKKCRADVFHKNGQIHPTEVYEISREAWQQQKC